jgi:hypothetical protein
VCGGHLLLLVVALFFCARGQKQAGRRLAQRPSATSTNMCAVGASQPGLVAATALGGGGGGQGSTHPKQRAIEKTIQGRS